MFQNCQTHLQYLLQDFSGVCDCFRKLCIKGLRHYLQNNCDERFHDEGPYHTETSPLICSANQWTGLYMTWTSTMKRLINKR